MNLPPVVGTVESLRAVVASWRRTGARIALVPTMGALHEGHLSLIRAARSGADRVVASLFVNPTQFAPSEDFAAYPRTFDRDRELLASVGTDLVYAPTAAVMYPDGFSSTVLAGGPALAGLEDAFRPHFFGGVATVVAKLLIQCAPDDALFGEKDYQQLLVIRRMARDLDLPVRILGAETVREADGLARSSRNAYLSDTERATAATLPRVMRACRAALGKGSSAGAVLARGRSDLTAAGFAVDYLELRDADTLGVLDAVSERPARLLVAVRLGGTRLIDNWAV